MTAFKVTPLEECEHYEVLKDTIKTEKAYMLAFSVLLRLGAILDQMRQDSFQGFLADE
jgi:hypothetical protein